MIANIVEYVLLVVLVLVQFKMTRGGVLLLVMTLSLIKPSRSYVCTCLQSSGIGKTFILAITL